MDLNVENLTALKCFDDNEVQLIQDASRNARTQYKKAEQFREMLIARNVISSNASFDEFMEMKDLVNALKLCWMLVIDDQNKPGNWSNGKMSDFDFVQIKPKAFFDLILDKNEYHMLVAKRTMEVRRISRNTDTFIRNMGWKEGPPSKKRALSAPVTKGDIIAKMNTVCATPVSNDMIVDPVIDNMPAGIFITIASDNVSSLTSLDTHGELNDSLGKAMAKNCIDDQAVEDEPLTKMSVIRAKMPPPGKFDKKKDNENLKAVLGEDEAIAVFREKMVLSRQSC
jgi:hypothetical protein